ncbi:MAG: sulfur carrier protein ThiS adenylyltransferase ThiF [Sporomusaceae bacterium]|jgi:sulfur carrier protein ThiS adenylyltransferase|nr:sulfur carrier protein ThiS adenylyltransferase ThiF [Sporomusaceae bacterium]
MENVNSFEQGLQRYLSADIIRGLQKVKIGIAGAGGLGSNCAQMLVRSGFKRFKIIDHDFLDCSNLNRQFYFLPQVGLAKVEALAANLQAINPAVAIEAAQIEFRRENAAEIFADCDVIVEAFDKPECKKLLLETYLESGKLVVAASGIAGWGNSDALKVTKIKKNFYLIGDLTTEATAENPPLAPKVVLAAAKQADVVLSYFLEQLTKGEKKS